MTKTVWGLATIKGGLPVWAEVYFSYDSFTMESDAEVQDICWVKKDGSRGKSVPEHIYRKVVDDDCQSCDVIECVQDSIMGPPDKEMVPFDD